MSEAYYIGMDLCSDSTQISFYNDISREPETVNQLNNKETYMMPNILFFGLETGEWYVGSEASEARFKEQGIVLDELFQNARSEETVEVHNTRYSYRKLFLMMLKMHVDSFLYRYEGATVKKLVITIPEYNKDLFRVLSTFYKELGVEKEQVEILTVVCITFLIRMKACAQTVWDCLITIRMACIITELISRMDTN